MSSLRSANVDLTVVGVISIEADPEVVAVGNSNISYTIITQPAGYNYMVEYEPADTSTPGIKEVVATCGSSAATCTVTVVGVTVDYWRPENTYDGEDSGVFTCSVEPDGLIPSSYTWSKSWPMPAYNDPQVAFSGGGADSTTHIINSHWFTTVNDPCTDVSGSYNIFCSVVIDGQIFSNTVPKTYTVAVLPEAGECHPPNCSAMSYYQIETNGYFMVTGVNIWDRTDADIDIKLPPLSQFITKVQEHELQHKNDYDNGFDGHVFYNKNEFGSLIIGLTNTTSTGLYEMVSSRFVQYQNAEILEITSLTNVLENRAYAVSDVIPPCFVYQQCGRFEM